MAETEGGRYFVTYIGTGVVELKGAGVFANGTAAFVGEDIARAALAQGGGWSVKDPHGKEIGSMPAPAKSAPAPAAPRHEEKKPETKHEETKHEEIKHEPAKAEAAPAPEAAKA
jgi:hypothetical protein